MSSDNVFLSQNMFSIDFGTVCMLLRLYVAQIYVQMYVFDYDLSNV